MTGRNDTRKSSRAQAQKFHTPVLASDSPNYSYGLVEEGAVESGPSQEAASRHLPGRGLAALGLALAALFAAATVTDWETATAYLAMPSAGQVEGAFKQMVTKSGGHSDRIARFSVGKREAGEHGAYLASVTYSMKPSRTQPIPEDRTNVLMLYRIGGDWKVVGTASGFKF